MIGMRIVETKALEWLGIVGITIFPWIFIQPRFSHLIPHESVHWEQQRRWFIYGLGVGLILYFVLYLFVLPVGWNPLRRKGETEAYRADGLSDEEISLILKRWPYMLWL